MSQTDSRCAGVVLIENSGYRLVQAQKAHYLDTKVFVVEKRTHVDAMGHEAWAPLTGHDTSAALQWLINLMGEHLVKDREVTRE
jgi:hypothetical protein